MALSMLAAVGCTCKKTVTDCEPNPEIQQKVDEYAEFALTSDLINTLSPNEKELVKIFIEIGQVMDEIYWDQYFGYANRDAIATLCDPAMPGTVSTARSPSFPASASVLSEPTSTRRT